MTQNFHRFSLLAALCVMLVAMTSCRRNDYLTGKWNLDAYADLFSSSQTLIPVPSVDAYILNFTSPSTFTFTTDCNTVSGNFKAGVEHICFSEISVTEIACDQEVVERSIKACLSLVNSYRVEGDTTLTMADGRGNILLKFKSL